MNRNRQRQILALSLIVLSTPLSAWAEETVTYLHTDALGSVVAISDEAGNIVERREYEPFGAQLTPVIADGPGYTGHVQDAVTGLTYMQQRYYDPEIGRFLSVDPITASGGDLRHFNRYGYAYNNPYKFFDPDGRLGCTASRIASICDHGGISDLRTSVRSPLDTGKNKQSGVPTNAGEQGSTSRELNSSGFSVKGLLVGKPSVVASGMAAAGVGVQATKGLYEADSSVGIVTPGLGLSSSVDVNLFKLSYRGSEAVSAPVEVKMGLDARGHAFLGGRFSAMYTPPSTFDLSIDAGAGAGAGFHLYEVNGVIKED